MNNLNKYLHLLVVPVFAVLFLFKSVPVHAGNLVEALPDGFSSYSMSWLFDYYIDTSTGEPVYRETSAITSLMMDLADNADHYAVMNQATYNATGYIAYYDADKNYLMYEDIFDVGSIYHPETNTYTYKPGVIMQLTPPANAAYYRVSITCISNDDNWMQTYCLNLFSMHYLVTYDPDQPLQDALEENNRLQSEANDLQAEANQLQAEANQQQQQMIDGYDNSTGSDVNDDFSGSVDSFQAAEDNLFGMVNYDQVDYDQYSDWLGIPAVSAALSFIANCMQSLFEGLGDLGIPIMIGLVLLLFSRLIGLQQLAGSGRRSGSGSSSAKRGG